MGSTSETGPAKTLGNFNDLISFCIGWGSKYMPPQKALEVANLQNVHQQATTVVKEVSILKAAYDITLNNRQLAFDSLKATSARVVNALASGGADKKIIADARTVNRKIRGARATKAGSPQQANANAAEPSARTISVAQLSYDNQLYNFEKLAELVRQDSRYMPNEKDLQMSGLDNYIETLSATNKKVIDAYTLLSNKRIERDSILYNEPGGLVPLALRVKLYAKSAFTITSPLYRQVSKIQFKNRP